MNAQHGIVACLVAVLVAGCATVPAGPSVMVWPAPEKPFEVFQADDGACRDWASHQAGIDPGEAVNSNLAGGAAMGALMGAGLGAAIGAASGHAGTGAAIGAAGGLIGGTAAASGPAYAVGWEIQQRYDMAYQQCMVAKGHQVPGHYQAARRTYRVPPPPPPPGYRPAPPPAHLKARPPVPPDLD
jgi:uncharacterized protein YcfJ